MTSPSRARRAAADAVHDARRGLWHLRHGGLEGLRRWDRRRRTEPRHSGGTTPRLSRDGSLGFDPWPSPDRPPVRPALRVAVVLDDFSRLAFGYEWDQVAVQPSTWRQELRARPVDLLFVESAWAGNGGGWRYHLTGPSAPRPDLVELVAWCREQGVPTVFWNKEDPAHFEDFLAAARLFDRVLTTDSDRLEAYRQALGHDRVGVLRFAAQPALHSPVRAPGPSVRRDVAFAGMWFAHRHPERRAQLDLLLGAALDVSGRMGTGLEIFSRQLDGDPRYQFPEPFASRVVGSLPYEQMLTAYRAYKVFLNVNTVVGSPTMCARRVFEITASGTPVVSTPSAALAAVFPEDQVPQVRTPEEARSTLRALVRSPELRDRVVHLAQRTVWEGHTYGHRVGEVLAAAGVVDPAPRRTPRVSALVSTRRPHQLEHVLATVGAQQGVEVELVLLAHGVDLDADEARRLAARHGVEHLVLLHEDVSVPLGACLNALVAAASGEVVAKMDDDDRYGPRYLADQVHALSYSAADVVGKQAHYVHLAALDATVLRYAEREHRFTDFVSGPTIVTTRALALATPFPAVPTGEDTGFLRAVAEAGGRTYSADRFGFVQVRNARPAHHTWGISDLEILASGQVTVFGTCDDHIMF